jgi:hypothetical protein
MKDITTSKGTFLFVEVPDGSMYHSVRYFLTGSVLEFLSNNQAMQIPIPTGVEFEFICTTKNATEEQAAMVVDTYAFFYTSYTEKNLLYKKAKTALKSLIKANNLDHTNNHAIIQKL